MGTKEKFLIDSNTLMAASRQYYAHDIVPSFWSVFENKLTTGDIILLDMVKAEIDKGEDALKYWIDDKADMLSICNHVNEKIIVEYGAVMQYIQECGFYNDIGLASWADASVADPWLIAAAVANDYTIITFEQRAGNLSIKNKSKKVKIPDVADYFNVNVQNLYYMMRQMKFKI